jgi:tetratricopeptide (TPR) repeat protein
MDVRTTCPATRRRGLIRLAAGMLAWGWVVAASAVPSTAPPADLDAFFKQVREASALTDPFQRCLHMPDPPGSHWHPEAVREYCAYKFPDVMTRATFAHLIDDGKAAEVDRAFAKYLDAQRRDPKGVSRLDGAYASLGLRDASAESRRLIDAWRRQRPDSAFAVAASGMQWYAAAKQGRGMKSNRETSADQMQTMETFGAMARDDLNKAAAMKPAFATLYSDQLGLAMYTGDDPGAADALAKGFALAPDDLSLWLSKAAFSAEKWGGSDAQVAQIGQAAEARTAKRPLMWVVVGRSHITLATHAQLQPPADGRFLAVVDEVAPPFDLGTLAAMAATAKKNDEALVLAVEALRFDDGNIFALNALSDAAYKTPQAPWAADMLRRGAAQHPDAMDNVRLAGMQLVYLGGTFAEATSLLESALAHDPKDKGVMLRLAEYALRAHDHYEDAKRLASKVIELYPDTPRAYVILIRAQIGTNDAGRIATIHYFLDHYGDDSTYAEFTRQMRDYLAGQEGKPG